MADLPGIWRLDHKLHPRTGFTIFFPGFILLVGLIMILFSQRLQAGHGAEGLAAVFAIDAAVVTGGFWLDFGNAVSWDNDRVYVRQGGSAMFFRRHPFASVPFSDIRGLILHPPPRGVPPKYPLLELDAPSHKEGPPLFIDPNYFTASSLKMFIDELCKRRPELLEGKQRKAIDRLLKILARQTKSR